MTLPGERNTHLSLIARCRRWLNDKLDGWAWERVGRCVGRDLADKEAQVNRIPDELIPDKPIGGFYG